MALFLRYFHNSGGALLAATFPQGQQVSLYGSPFREAVVRCSGSARESQILL